MTGMLASVAGFDEAASLIPLGVDILDLKNPSQGALGALDMAEVRRIVEAFPNQVISATVGDLPMIPEVIRDAVETMAQTQVDYVKVGFFLPGDWHLVLDQLKPLADRGVKLVGVLFADQPISIDVLPAFRAAGFHGLMVDTADKTRGGLLQWRDLPWLRSFVDSAQSLGCLSGLAGSLCFDDIATLKPLGADYLGFRGALCTSGRTGRLDLESAHRVRAAVATRA